MPIDQTCPACHKDTHQNPECYSAAPNEITCPYCGRVLVSYVGYRGGDWRIWCCWVKKTPTAPLRSLPGIEL